MNSGESTGEGGPRKVRAFIALKTPAVWDEKLAELQRDLRSKFGSNAFRWVKPEQIHITVRFFGWIRLTDVNELVDLLPPICSAHASFTLNCEGLGAFPNMRRPRVLWAGLKGDIANAAALQGEITSATGTFGDRPEDRPFKPHLTLARLTDPGRDQITDLEHAIGRGFQIDSPWRVDQVLLMQSHLSPTGSTYEPLAMFRLG